MNAEQWGRVWTTTRGAGNEAHMDNTTNTAASTGTAGVGSGDGGDHLDQLLNNPDTTTLGGDTAGGDTAAAAADGGDTRDGGDTASGDAPGDSGGDDAGDTGGDEPLTRSDLERESQRIADRTVNAVLRELRGGKGKRRTTTPADDTVNGGGEQNQNQSRSKGESTGGGSEMDVREARMAYREYVTDRHTFLDAAERAIGNDLAGGLIATGLADHGDPDQAARTAADTVAQRLSDYRKTVEQATVAALRKRGALADSTSRGGTSAPPGAAPAASNLADKRTAARQAADRYNAQQGHTDPDRQAG